MQNLYSQMMVAKNLRIKVDGRVELSEQASLVQLVSVPSSHKVLSSIPSSAEI